MFWLLILPKVLTDELNSITHPTTKQVQSKLLMHQLFFIGKYLQGSQIKNLRGQTEQLTQVGPCSLYQYLPQDSDQWKLELQ